MPELWTCAYCGQQHPRQFFYLRDAVDDPDPCCWGCSDRIERGELAPHYPADNEYASDDADDYVAW